MDPEAGPSTSEPSKRRRRRNIMQAEAGSGHIPFTSPPQKRPPKVITSSEKIIIINIFKYVQKSKLEHELVTNHELVKKTSEISGVSERSIYRVLADYRDTHKILEPDSKRIKPSIVEKVDDFDKSAIRRIVHRFYLNNELPNLKKILQAVNDDETLPTLSMTSLRRILKKLNFKFMKKQRNSFLIDRHEIVLWRIKYLAQIQQHRQENRRIFYTDETWVNAGHTVAKSWVDTTIKSTKQAFLEGLSTGAKDPVSKGKRLIVVHIGNEEGFIEDCDWVFESKTTGDYHESMDAAHFEAWFEKVLTKVQANDVIVLDNASYHSRRIEKTPTMAWKKAAIQEWLQSKEISFENSEVKRELITKVNEVKGQYQKYVIDEMAKQKGVTVLRLPPYHCELNPIELIWADVKGYVARHNTTFKFDDVKKLLKDGLEQITPHKWANCVEHIKKIENNMRGLDHSIDRTVDQFIIHVSDAETSESSSESEDSDVAISET